MTLVLKFFKDVGSLFHAAARAPQSL